MMALSRKRPMIRRETEEDPILIDLTCDEILEDEEIPNQAKHFRSEKEEPMIQPSISTLPEAWEGLSSDYTVDYFCYLKSRELVVPLRRQYLGRSPQLHLRRHLVDWTFLVGQKLNLSKSTLHLSVRLMDYFMDAHNVEKHQIHLLALVAMRLAAKFEDKESSVPKTATLNKFTNPQNPKKDFQKLEVMLLSFFNFQLNLPTSMNFLECFRNSCLIDPNEDMIIGKLRKSLSLETIVGQLTTFMTYFLDIYLQHQEFVPIQPSVMAFAIVHCSREALNIVPSWPQRFVNKYGIRVNRDILVCSAALLKKHHENLDKQHLLPNNKTSSDEGYNSSRDWSPI